MGSADRGRAQGPGGGGGAWRPPLARPWEPVDTAPRTRGLCTVSVGSLIWWVELGVSLRLGSHLRLRVLGWGEMRSILIPHLTGECNAQLLAPGSLCSGTRKPGLSPNVPLTWGPLSSHWLVVGLPHAGLSRCPSCWHPRVGGAPPHLTSGVTAGAGHTAPTDYYLGDKDAA